MMNILDVLADVKLQFNITHPSLEECYAQGYQSSLADSAETQNPYRSGKEREYWIDGWWAGIYGETPLFEVQDAFKNVSEQYDYAANDAIYTEHKQHFLLTALEISGAIAISVFFGYQIIELVA